MPLRGRIASPSLTKDIQHGHCTPHVHTQHTSITMTTSTLMQSYPARALDRRLHEDWARDAREGPRVLMSLRVDFGPMG